MKKNKLHTRSSNPALWDAFCGYLEGSGKSRHTLTNYRSDIRHFMRFLEFGLARGHAVRLTQLGLEDIKRYSRQLQKDGAKTNTRRRRLLTIRRWIRFLHQRKKVGSHMDGFAERIVTPSKMERIPHTHDYERLRIAFGRLPHQTPIETRNQALLMTLLETGAQVSEVVKLRWENLSVDLTRGTAHIGFEGKNARQVVISMDLYGCLQNLRVQTAPSKSPWMFQGHNRYGSLGGAITPRGVELLVRSTASDLKLDHLHSSLTPRNIRHAAVIQWIRMGITRSEIQSRLGLKSDYAFRVYAPFFKKTTPPHSSEIQQNPLESTPV